MEICDDTFTGHRGRTIEIFEKNTAEQLDISFHISNRLHLPCSHVCRGGR